MGYWVSVTYTVHLVNIPSNSSSSETLNVMIKQLFLRIQAPHPSLLYCWIPYQLQKAHHGQSCLQNSVFQWSKEQDS